MGYFSSKTSELPPVASASDGTSKGLSLIIGFSRCGCSRIKAPFGLQRLLNLLGVTELEIAYFLRDDGAFMLWLQLGDQLGLEPAGLLGIQVAHFLRDIKEGGDNLVMALFSTFLCNAPCTANFHRELLAAGVSHKLAWLLLHILGGT